MLLLSPGPQRRHWVARTERREGTKGLLVGGEKEGEIFLHGRNVVIDFLWVWCQLNYPNYLEPGKNVQIIERTQIIEVTL